MFGSGGWLGFGLGVGNTYISIVTSVTMEYPISGAMMVSRDNDRFRESLQAMIDAHPTEIALWVDTTRVKRKDIIAITKEFDTDIPIHVRLQVKYKSDHKIHHDSITKTFHHMIRNAKHKVVLISDDDDSIMFDARMYAPIIYHNPWIGVIYGDVEAHYSEPEPLIKLRKSRPIITPRDGKFMRGSCQVYNRDAFIEASKHIDINNKHLFQGGKRPVWFGYFLDWQPAYWLCRLGYHMMYTDKIFCTQTVNPNQPDARKDLWGKWGEVCDFYDSLSVA